MSTLSVVLLILALLLLGVGIYYLATSCSRCGAVGQVATDSTVQVSGTASVEAQPDEVTLVGTVQTVAPTAQQATVENDTIVRQVLQSVGQQQWTVVPKVETQRYNVTPQYPVLENGRRDTSAAPVSYRAEHALELQFQSKDTAAIGRQAATLATLLTSSGVSELSGPYFRVSQRNTAREQARQAAVRVAQRRAAELARLSGVAVVGLKELTDDASAGPFFAERVMADATGSSAAPIQTPQSETIRHTVTATYFVA